MAVDLTNDINLVTTPSEVVNFDKNTPTTSGVVFTPDTPLTQDVLYVSSTNASTWIYDGEAYVTYTATPTATTPFYIQDTTIDAGGNKTAPIQHNGYIKAYGFYGSGAGINFLNANYLAAGTVPTARLGTGTANSSSYLRGDGTWAVIANGGKVGIPNQTTGIFTYYSTLEDARDSAVSGDTIFVYPGTYTITTTDTAGIAKDGVNYYFHSGAIVNKATTGSIFYDNSFVNPCNVYGYGIFNKSVGTGLIYYSSKAYSVFNSLDLSNTVGVCVQMDGSYSKANVRYAISSGAVCINWNGSYGDFKFKYVKSTAWIALNCNPGSYLNAEGEVIESTVTRGVYLNGNVRGIFNIALVQGNGNSGFDAYASNFIFTGSTNYLYPFSCNTIFNGFATTIVTSGTLVGGASCTNLTVNNDYGDSGRVDVQMSGPGLTITQSAGVSNIKLPKSFTYLKVAMSGGTMSFDTTQFNDGYYYGAGYQFIISGGRVNLNDLQATLVDRDDFIILNGGILDLGRSRLSMSSSLVRTFVNSTTGRQNIINWTAGTLISNGARLLTLDSNCLPIYAQNTGLILKVLSGGLNTNTTVDLKAAKKRKWKCTISSVTANVGITLNDGSGANEVFQENNIATYNTKALLAQRLASLINASATLDITATQNTPGTDEYFYLEDDVAGQLFTTSATPYLSIQIITSGSKAITENCGGTIIQNANIE